MLTLDDVVLPDFSIDYTNYLTEREKNERLKTCSLLSRNFSEENAKFDLELKNLNREFEDCKMKDIEVRKEVEHLTALCTQNIKQLEMIKNSIKEVEFLINDVEYRKSKEEFESLENAKKTLNVYKRLLKLKWLNSSKEDQLESIIFNDKHAFLKFVKFDKNDTSIAEKIWIEISRACCNNWKELLNK